MPLKNLVPVNGKPLIEWTINASLCTEQINRTIVSTDDDEIASISTGLGAEIVRRPADISGHFASSEAAILHVLEELKSREDYGPDLVVFLQATAPIRGKFDISDAIEKFIAEEADSMLSVSATPGFIWKIDDDGSVPISFELEKRPRSQEIKDKYVIENGSIYIFKPEIIIQKNNRLGGKIVAFYQNAISSFDIDYPEDLEVVDVLLREFSSPTVEV